MKFLKLIWVNLKRKKTRLILTTGSFAVALFLFGLLTAINNAFYQSVEVAGADRLITRNKISLIMYLPYSYKDKIRQMDGVNEATFACWFGGYYQDQKNFFPQFAIDTDTYRTVFSEFVIPDSQWQDFLKDRQGCIIGKSTAERYGFKVGDRIPLIGTIFRGTWEFNVSGIYEGTREQDDLTQFWFHYKYLEEMSTWVKGSIGWLTVKVNNPDDSLDVSRAIDTRFANSHSETKTEPESMFAAGFVKQFGNIKMLLISVGAVVFFTLILVTGSTMAMAVRERTAEIAVLKTIGFSDIKVLLLVISESMSFAVAGGGTGLLLAKLFTMRGDPTGGLLPLFYMSSSDIFSGLGITVVIGLAAGIIPAVNAMKLQIVNALRRV